MLHRSLGNFESDEAKQISRLKKMKDLQDALTTLKKTMGILAREEQK